MSATRGQPTSVRLWCIAATEAPIIAVFARVSGGKPRTCILRWNYEANTVEEGAWTGLKIGAHRCALSSSGEFLRYHATSPAVGGAFEYGAFAVSRLPWIAALTYTYEFHYPPTGNRHAIGDRDQTYLWSIFDHCPENLSEFDWPAHLGAGWSASDCGPTADDRPSGFRRCAITPISGAAWCLRATLQCRLNRERRPNWSIWDRKIRFDLIAPSLPIAAPVELSGVRWAHPAPGGRILVATDDAHIQIRHVCQDSTGRCSAVIEFDYDLSSLAPRSQPAPAWATAALPERPRRSD